MSLYIYDVYTKYLVKIILVHTVPVYQSTNDIIKPHTPPVHCNTYQGLGPTLFNTVRRTSTYSVLRLISLTDLLITRTVQVHYDILDRYEYVLLYSTRTR